MALPFTSLGSPAISLQAVRYFSGSWLFFVTYWFSIDWFWGSGLCDYPQQRPITVQQLSQMSAYIVVLECLVEICFLVYKVKDGFRSLSTTVGWSSWATRKLKIGKAKSVYSCVWHDSFNYVCPDCTHICTLPCIVISQLPMGVCDSKNIEIQ